MPRKVELFVRGKLIGHHCRTYYYYEFRNGKRLMSPAVQKEIRALFRKIGWNESIKLDDYVEDYDW